MAYRLERKARYMNALEYFVKRFNLDLNHRSPIEILEINRPIMAECLAELGFNLGAEVGVQEGDHSMILLKANPKLKLFCVDSWENYPGYKDFTHSLPKIGRMAKKNLAPFNAKLIKKFSMDALKDFEDESLDFVYIDAAHDFKNVAMDMAEWHKKVRKGGIVFGHDYLRKAVHFDFNVIDVVPAWCYAKGIQPWFILGSKGPIDGKFCEWTRSWMYVK